MTTPPAAPPITIDAVVERTPSGLAWDAYVLVADHQTGAYVKRGRVFRCRNLATRWLRRQSAQVVA